jgi:hypothetical protein
VHSGTTVPSAPPSVRGAAFRWLRPFVGFCALSGPCLSASRSPPPALRARPPVWDTNRGRSKQARGKTGGDRRAHLAFERASCAKPPRDPPSSCAILSAGFRRVLPSAVVGECKLAHALACACVRCGAVVLAFCSRLRFALLFALSPSSSTAHPRLGRRWAVLFPTDAFFVFGLFRAHARALTHVP